MRSIHNSYSCITFIISVTKSKKVLSFPVISQYACFSASMVSFFANPTNHIVFAWIALVLSIFLSSTASSSSLSRLAIFTSCSSANLVVSALRHAASALNRALSACMRSISTALTSIFLSSSIFHTDSLASLSFASVAAASAWKAATPCGPSGQLH